MPIDPTVHFRVAARLGEAGPTFDVCFSDHQEWPCRAALLDAADENAELRATFDLQHAAGLRAIKLWQAAHRCS
jgi:hypothetical protein